MFNLKIFIHRFDELNLEAEPNNEATFSRYTTIKTITTPGRCLIYHSNNYTVIPYSLSKFNCKKKIILIQN